MPARNPTPKPRHPAKPPARPQPAPVTADAPALRPRLDNGQVGGTHYRDMAITPWEFLESALTQEEMSGYLKAEAIVYIARERHKGGREDIEKAVHTLQKLLDVTPPF